MSWLRDPCSLQQRRTIAVRDLFRQCHQRRYASTESNDGGGKKETSAKAIDQKRFVLTLTSNLIAVLQWFALASGMHEADLA